MLPIVNPPWTNRRHQAHVFRWCSAILSVPHICPLYSSLVPHLPANRGVHHVSHSLFPPEFHSIDHLAATILDRPVYACPSLWPTPTCIFASSLVRLRFRFNRADSCKKCRRRRCIRMSGTWSKVLVSRTFQLLITADEISFLVRRITQQNMPNRQERTKTQLTLLFRWFLLLRTTTTRLIIRPFKAKIHIGSLNCLWTMRRTPLSRVTSSLLQSPNRRVAIQVAGLISTPLLYQCWHTSRGRPRGTFKRQPNWSPPPSGPSPSSIFFFRLDFCFSFFCFSSSTKSMSLLNLPNYFEFNKIFQHNDLPPFSLKINLGFFYLSEFAFLYFSHNTTWYLEEGLPIWIIIQYITASMANEPN